MAFVRSHCTPSSALADGGARCSVVTSRTRASITRMILPRIVHSSLCSWCAALCVPPVQRLGDVPFRRTRCGYAGLCLGGLEGMDLLTPDVRRLPPPSMRATAPQTYRPKRHLTVCHGSR